MIYFNAQTCKVQGSFKTFFHYNKLSKAIRMIRLGCIGSIFTRNWQEISPINILCDSIEKKYIERGIHMADPL